MFYITLWPYFCKIFFQTCFYNLEIFTFTYYLHLTIDASHVKAIKFIAVASETLLIMINNDEISMDGVTFHLSMLNLKEFLNNIYIKYTDRFQKSFR